MKRMKVQGDCISGDVLRGKEYGCLTRKGQFHNPELIKMVIFSEGNSLSGATHSGTWWRLQFRLNVMQLLHLDRFPSQSIEGREAGWLGMAITPLPAAPMGPERWRKWRAIKETAGDYYQPSKCLSGRWSHYQGNTLWPISYKVHSDKLTGGMMQIAIYIHWMSLPIQCFDYWVGVTLQFFWHAMRNGAYLIC